MKCYVCKIPCEEVWMFGVSSETEHLKDREYCEACFKPIADKLLPQRLQPNQEVDNPEIAHSA